MEGAGHPQVGGGHEQSVIRLGVASGEIPDQDPGCHQADPPLDPHADHAGQCRHHDCSTGGLGSIRDPVQCPAHGRRRVDVATTYPLMRMNAICMANSSRFQNPPSQPSRMSSAFPRPSPPEVRKKERAAATPVRRTTITQGSGTHRLQTSLSRLGARCYGAPAPSWSLLSSGTESRAAGGNLASSDAQ